MPGNDYAVAAVRDNSFRNAVGYNHGKPCGHGLYYHQGKRFVTTWKDEHIRAPIDLGYLGWRNDPTPLNSFGGASCWDASNEKLQPGKALTRFCHCRERYIKP